MPLGTHIGHGQDGGFAQLTLDREIEVFSVWESIVNVVAGEIRQRLVNRKVECLVCRAARSRDGEGEALSLRRTVLSVAERFFEQDRLRAGPVQAEGSVSYFVKEIQILNRCVVQAIRSTDAALSRPAKYLAQRPFAKARRVSQSDARSKLVVFGRGQRLGNACIARIYQALGGSRKDR